MSINEIAKCCEVCGYSSCELFGYRLSDGLALVLCCTPSRPVLCG